VVLYDVLEGLRVIAGLLYPFMPRASQVMQEHLAMGRPEIPQTLADLNVWGKTEGGVKLPKTITLFPRVDDMDELESKGSEGTAPENAPLSGKPEISMKTFQKIDLRVATVIQAEPLPRAKNLLQLKVDVGEERTIVAGIAGSYEPEDLIGKQVVIVANLKPAKLMGVLSQGMVLTASNKGTCALLTLDRHSESGTPVG
jgi:methionyl-tRNA synthetase